MMIGSQNGQIYAANRAACRMLGWDEKEICRLGRKGIVEQTSQFLAAVTKRKETGIFFGELIFIKKDGTRFPVEISSSAYNDSDGGELATIIARDITQRKTTENALKESEERLRLASKATGFGSYSYDFNAGNAFYSDEFLLLYGLPPGETIELDADLAAKALHPDDKQRFLYSMKMSNHPLGSGIHDIEFRIIHTDGKIRWLRSRGLTTFSGTASDSKPLRANGIIQDITIRKQAEESLAESTTLLKSIMDSTTDLIWSVDPARYELLTFNKALEIFFRNEGIKIEKGMFLNDILPEELVKKLSDLYSQTLQKDFVITEYATTLGSRILLINLNLLSRENKPYAISVFAKDITERKLSELSLRQANDWQQKIFEGSLDAIFISDKNSGLVAVNSAACDLTGYSKEQLLKMRIPDLHDDLDLEAYWKYHARIFKGEKILSEAKLLRPDGIKVDAEFNNSRISISGEYYMHTTVRDITERKKTEAAVKESERRYRSLFENSPIGISATGLTGELLQANLPFARMYGFESVAQMLAELKNVNKLFSNLSDRANIVKALKQNGKTDAMEFEVIKRDGTRFFVLSSGVEVRDLTGNFLYFQASHIDLTERKRIEEKIHSASLYARSLIEASLDPLITINADGKITDVNLSTEQITGIDRTNLIGSDFAEYFVNPSKARKGYKTAFSKGIVKDYPLTLLHTSGRRIHVLYNATLFKNEKGEVQGVFAAARDITDQRKMELELLKSKELLEKLNQHLVEVRENERNQIALNLHDDLGQKLTAINLDIAWLKSRIGVQSKTVREKFLEMSSMIKETIESIKETSSFLRPAILFDLGLIPAINSHLNRFEKQTGIKCHLSFKPKEFLLEDQLSLILYRILQESMTNIARHSGAKTAEVTLVVLRDKVEMSIKDDGIGIEKTKVNSVQSMGIAGIKERVKSVNGNIAITSENGTGTLIKVIIPLLKAKNND
jgi:PAS domain S-box-containing protein